MNNIVIRVDGNSRIGLGHIIRCLSLAQMLKEDFKIIFVIKEPDLTLRSKIEKEGFLVVSLAEGDDEFLDKDGSHWVSENDIVVLDGYQFSEEFTSQLQKKSHKLIVIDDNARLINSSDVIINYNLHAKELFQNSKVSPILCLGTDFALLRKEFLEVADNRIFNSNASHLLLCFGGADSRNFTLWALKILNKSKFIRSITVIVGSANKHLEQLKTWKNESTKEINLEIDIDAKRFVEVITSCDFALCASGVMALELIAIGVPLIAGYVAENQRQIAFEIASKGAGINLGDWANVSELQLLQAVEEVSSSIEIRQSMLQSQKSLVDKKSSERILKLFQSLV